MKITYSRNKIVFWTVTIIIALLLLVLPLKIPNTIHFNGRLMPQQEWILSKGSDGRLMSNLTDHENGIHNSYSFHLFERGDYIDFQLYDYMASGVEIFENDTIGFVRSYFLDKKISDLESAIYELEHYLKFRASGEKPPIISQATKELLYAKVEADLNETIKNRLGKLKHKDFVSVEEFEFAESTAEMKKLAVDIAEAKLETFQTGAKIEEINYIRSQKKALQKELDIFIKQKEKYDIIAPISGVSTHLFSSDTLLQIINNNNYIALLPIKYIEKSKIDLPNKISLKIRNTNKKINAEIIRINESHYTIKNEPALIAVARVEKTQVLLLPGLSVTGSITIENIVIREYIFEFFSKVFGVIKNEIGI